MDAVEVNTKPQTLNNIDNTTYPGVRSQVPGNDNHESVALAVPQPAGQLLSAEVSQNTSILLTKLSEEEGHTSAALELPDLSGPFLDEEISGNVVAVPAVIDEELQADRPAARVLKSWPRLTRKNHVDQPTNLETWGLLKPQSAPVMAMVMPHTTGRHCRHRHGQRQRRPWMEQRRVHPRRK